MVLASSVSLPILAATAARASSMLFNWAFNSIIFRITSAHFFSRAFCPQLFYPRIVLGPERLACSLGVVAPLFSAALSGG